MRDVDRAGARTGGGLNLARTQELILSGYAELIEELGTDDVSFRLVARRAGVGERTVFRHYRTRVELLLAVADWIEETVFVRPELNSIFDLPMQLRQSMEAYSRRPELAHVVAEAAMRGSGGGEPAASRDRFDRLIQYEAPVTSQRQRRDIVVALTHLDSAGAWVALRRQFGDNPAEISDAAGWAAEALLHPLRGAAHVNNRDIHHTR
ncbi:TetR/AcrR family transcriptional regulator [Citricoccus muralis]|uniref:Helix-turn-helix domain containing protein n=1 Tax=Citricoccus muralis TaxID=169134 RepID=A0ABY8H7F6_9MICC|nr:TetR/AcrR family transcriptional regulator [Citricoccus muralis]WFP17075.1 helix-turn-helix domain containing protein [Citricoccus muralis]